MKIDWNKLTVDELYKLFIQTLKDGEKRRDSESINNNS